MICYLVLATLGEYLELIVYNVLKHNGFVYGIAIRTKGNLATNPLTDAHCSERLAKSDMTR